jgi:hypothetical protein
MTQQQCAPNTPRVAYSAVSKYTYFVFRTPTSLTSSLLHIQFHFYDRVPPQPLRTLHEKVAAAVVKTASIVEKKDRSEGDSIREDFIGI